MLRLILSNKCLLLKEKSKKKFKQQITKASFKVLEMYIS